MNENDGGGEQVTTGGAGEAAEAIPELVIISGMSGAGRSHAAKCLEDLGWFVVDNLPPALIPTMVDLGARSQGNVARIAVVVDVRGRRFFDNLRESLA
ncbi:MAG: RNase adapter protein RapZ, partial [Streptomyces sp.]|nr:RNase adapter protein RapZ [Streptomyces sp.]